LKPSLGFKKLLWFNRKISCRTFICGWHRWKEWTWRWIKRFTYWTCWYRDRRQSTTGDQCAPWPCAPVFTFITCITCVDLPVYVVLHELPVELCDSRLDSVRFVCGIDSNVFVSKKSEVWIDVSQKLALILLIENVVNLWHCSVQSVSVAD